MRHFHDVDSCLIYCVEGLAVALCISGDDEQTTKRFPLVVRRPQRLLKPLFTDEICRWQWADEGINSMPRNQWCVHIYDHRWNMLMPSGMLGKERDHSHWGKGTVRLACVALGLSLNTEKDSISALEFKSQTAERNAPSHWCVVILSIIYVGVFLHYFIFFRSSTSPFQVKTTGNKWT